MKHLSLFRRWATTGRQLRLALAGLVLLFVTLVFSTLDFTLQLNRYTIASSRDSLQSTARSSIAALDSYLERQMSYVQRAATAIAGLPAGSGEEQVRQLLDEYFQRSDFAQMWAVSLDKQAISSQGVSLDLSGEEALDKAFDGQSGYSAIYNSHNYKDDRFYVYVPVRVSPEQPVTGAVLGVLQVDQLARALTLYGLSDQSRVAVFQVDGMILYACGSLNHQLEPGGSFWATDAGQTLGSLPKEEEGCFGTNGTGSDAVAYLCVSTGIRDWYLYQDVPQSALLATNAQETRLMLLMALKMLAASVIMLVLLAVYHRQRESQVQRAEESLRTSNQLLAMALQHTAVTLFVYDLASRTMTACDETNSGQTGVPVDPAALVHNGTVAPRHSTEFLALFHRIHSTQDPVQGDFLVRGPGQSEYRWTRVTLTAVRIPGQMPTHAIVTFEDITEERRREDELRQRACRDPLTNLYNRRGLRMKVNELLTLPDPPGQAALLMMDLDHFKEVNDILGHPVGDLLLREVARLLDQLTPASGTPVRLGGDEFIVFLPGADWTTAEALAGRICTEMPGLSGRLELRVPVGVSVGVHLFDPAAVPLNQAYQQADTALYAAKRSRGRWVSTRRLRESGAGEETP